MIFAKITEITGKITETLLFSWQVMIDWRRPTNHEAQPIMKQAESVSYCLTLWLQRVLIPVTEIPSQMPKNPRKYRNLAILNKYQIPSRSAQISKENDRKAGNFEYSKAKQLHPKMPKLPTQRQDIWQFWEMQKPRSFIPKWLEFQRKWRRSGKLWGI